MAERLQVDDLQFWHDAVCTHILEAVCTEYEPDFHFDLALARRDDVQISRVNSVRHTWKRTEKQVRHSSCDQLILCLQTRGTSVQIQDGREIYLQEGEMTCTDTTRPIEMQLHGDFEQVLVHLPRSLVMSSFGSTESLTSFEVGKGNPLGSVVIPFLRNVSAVFESLPEGSTGRLIENAASLVLTLLSERTSKPLEDPRWLQNSLRCRAEEYIRRNSHDRELSPKHVAKALNVSLRHLQEVFQDAGTTASDLIWERRLRNSEQDLSNSILASLNITEIAFRSGFGDTAHFSRRFKDRYGMSPREFRLNHASQTKARG